MTFTYEYPRAALTVDCVVFAFDGEAIKVLLIERRLEPFRGKWALPGGFVRVDEELDDAARRELAEETGVQEVTLEQVYTFGKRDRDPRERIISVAYCALTRLDDHNPRADTDAKQAVWFSLDELPKLAFDHAHILERSLSHLRKSVRNGPIGFQLLPPKFTLTQLQALYSAVLGTEIDTRNFRKRVLAMDGLVVAVKNEYQRGRQRPAQLYRFEPRRYAQLQKSGFHFEL